MQIVEHNQHRLILCFQRSLAQGLLFGISFTLGGLIFCLFGLLLIQQAQAAWILPCGIGSTLIFSGIFWLLKFPQVMTITIDKSKNCLLWEQRALLSQPTTQSLEFPINLIAGVEIATSFDSDTTGYYPTLILKQVYWRIRLDCDASYHTAVTITKTVAQFLNVDYFLNQSQAPLPTWKQKLLTHIEPYQASWQYIENEIDRLQQHLSQSPLDAEAHQELGILLAQVGTLFHSRHQEATAHLKQAESLFELQQQLERAVLAKVLQALVNWNY